MLDSQPYANCEIARANRTQYADMARGRANEPYLAVALLEEIRQRVPDHPNMLAKILNSDLKGLIDAAAQHAAASIASQAEAIKKQISGNPKRLQILQNMLWKKALMHDFAHNSVILAEAPEQAKFAMEDEEDKVAGEIAETLHAWTAR
jgi:hypothetical protein